MTLIRARGLPTGNPSAGALAAASSVLLMMFALVFLVGLVTGAGSYHGELHRSVGAIVGVGAISVLALGLAIASLRQAKRYRQGTARLRSVISLQALALLSLLPAFVGLLALGAS